MTQNCADWVGSGGSLGLLDERGEPQGLSPSGRRLCLPRNTMRELDLDRIEIELRNRMRGGSQLRYKLFLAYKQFAAAATAAAVS